MLKITYYSELIEALIAYNHFFTHGRNCEPTNSYDWKKYIACSNWTDLVNRVLIAVNCISFGATD